MDPDDLTFNVTTVTRRWWVPVVRGVGAILFGIVTITLPGISLLTLVLLWGAYALVDGAFNLMLAARRGRAGESWGWFVLEGIVSIATSAVTFAWPGLTALALLTIIALWGVVTGITEIVAAVRLRKQIRGEWMLALAGVLSIAFGVLLLMFPGTGALALLWVIAGYAFAFGVLLIALGLRLHRLGATPTLTGGMRPA
jgi:uncharacterized membrane protein HdeD (DUF308 family)